MGKSMKPGGGGRFAAGKAALEAKGMGANEAGAIMANAGRKKYGEAKMAAWSKAGKARAQGYSRGGKMKSGPRISAKDWPA